MIKRGRSFWIIVDGETPTAFRAHVRETLLPTLHQLQKKRPTVVLRWFEHNRLWQSQEEAQEAQRARYAVRKTRTPAWRPGGSHADPRAKYDLTRDQKRARFKQRSFGPRPPGAAGRPPGRPPGGPRRKKPDS